MNDKFKSDFKNQSIKHIEELVNEIDYLFDPSIDLHRLSCDLYELLLYYGKNDYQIQNSKCDETIFQYIYDREIKYIRFRQGFNEAKQYVLNEIKAIYDQDLKYDRESSSNGYVYYDNPQYRNYIASKVIPSLIKQGYSYQDFLNGEADSYIYSTIVMDKARVRSIGRKNDRIRTMDALRNSKMTPEQRRAFVIAVVTFFAIVGISTAVYNNRQENKKNREERREKGSVSAKHTASFDDIENKLASGYYNFDDNVFVVEDGEPSARL